ncbi:hypothetical protein IFM89_036287 [Coptis chinensis]|uniref:Delta(3)-Delta(2)-enoyl-CoA isomerase n=1 Tax=Coptis chinensis TaxID=261450 RepID=A0A835MB67_9MAGN|nr:hypothetical protein IFM89_036287 [Coptis chinensis]
MDSLLSLVKRGGGSDLNSTAVVVVEYGGSDGGGGGGSGGFNSTVVVVVVVIVLIVKETKPNKLHVAENPLKLHAAENPLTGSRFKSPLPKTFPKELNTLDFKLFVLCKQYLLEATVSGSELETEYYSGGFLVKHVYIRALDNCDVIKVVVSSTATMDNFVIMGIHVYGLLVVCKSGDVAWTVVREDQKCRFHDLIHYKGEFYARFVESNGDLFLVDIYLDFGPRFAEWNETCGPTYYSGEGRPSPPESRGESVPNGCKVYKLNERKQHFEISSGHKGNATLFTEDYFYDDNHADQALHHDIGVFNLEETRGNIFLLTLTGETEHRLNPTFITQIRTLLTQIRSEAKPGSVLITTAQGKFFSNGLDLASVQSNVDRLNEMVFEFRSLLADLISLPLPTIAAVTGHAAAAGFVLAIAHDYVLMRKDRGVLYMSEVDIGLTFADYFTAMLRAKIGSPRNLRDMVLQGVKIRGEEGVKMGIIDSAHDNAEKTVEAALSLGEKLGVRKWNGEVYREIRKSVFKEVLPVLGLVEKVVVAARL